MMLSLLVVACTLLNSAIASQLGCYPGWTLYPEDGTCLRVVTGNPQRHIDGAKMCRQFLGGRVAALTTQEKAKFVTDMIRQTPAPSAWVASHYRILEKINYLGQNVCPRLTIDAGKKCYVSLVNCEEKNAFVCSTQATTDTEIVSYNLCFGDTKTGCPIGWTFIPTERTCVKAYFDYGSAGDTFYTARKVCQRENADLVSMNDDAKVHQIAELMVGLYLSPPSAWIGVYKEYGPRSSFQSLDGKELTYTLWMDSPFRPRMGETFVQYVKPSEENSHGKWRQADCEDTAGFVCEKPAATKLPESDPFNKDAVRTGSGCLAGWTFYPRKQKCLKVFNDGYGEIYQVALSICQGYHGYLAQVQDDEKNGFVTQLLNYTLPSHKAWIATWTPDGELYPKYYSDSKKQFVEMEDGPQRKIDTCLAMSAVREGSTVPPRWEYLHCSKRSAFICEAPVYYAAGRCPEDWNYFEKDDSCFKVSNKQKMSWLDARDNCKDAGGDLFMPVGGGDEKTAVVRAMQKKNTFYWIGISDPDNDGQFLFINGGRIDKSIPWQKGEPNHLYCKELCAEMKNGLLYDKGCWMRRNFVCELFL